MTQAEIDRVNTFRNVLNALTMSDIQGVTNAQMDAWTNAWCDWVIDPTSFAGGQHPKNKPPL